MARCGRVFVFLAWMPLLAASGHCGETSCVGAAKETVLLSTRMTLHAPRDAASSVDLAAKPLLQALVAPRARSEGDGPFVSLLEGLSKVGITPEVQEIIAKMLEDIEGTFPKIVESSKNDTRLQNRTYAHFDTIASRLLQKDAAKDEAVDAARELHKSCRLQESSLSSQVAQSNRSVAEAAQKRDEQLALWQKQHSGMCVAPDSLRSLSASALAEHQDHAEQYQEAMNDYIQAFQDYAAKSAENVKVAAEHTGQVLKCRQKQQAFEDAVCGAGTSLQATCAAYASAYEIHKEEYVDIGSGIAARVTDRKAEWKHLKRVECVLRELAASGEDGNLGDDSSAISKLRSCYVADFENSKFTIAELPPPAQQPCQAPTWPCTADFVQQEYAEFPIDAPAATCASSCLAQETSTQMPAPTPAPEPASLAAILVVDGRNRVLRCPAKGGGDCSTVAGGQGEGGGPRQLKTPWGVAVAPNGDVLVADTFNHRVQRCPTSGSGDCGTVAGVQGEGNGLQQLDRPFGVAVAPNGDFLVVDLGNHRIQRCPGSGSGDCSTVAGRQGHGTGPQQLFYPTGVAVAPSGDFVVADKSNNRVQLCPASGSGDCSTVVGGSYYPKDVALILEA
mmetsp:Transcript_136030/g.352713  ORF Transcript_136030/g.352713 Transcript_136030/m.352713 type:complete len:618 (+) Transcript_136030:55-1908(+)